MKFYNYIHEDAQENLDYKKAIFDMKVAIEELEYMKQSNVPTDMDKLSRYKERKKSLKEKIMMLKEKIQKMSEEVGEKIDPKLQALLDRIPDKPETSGDNDGNN